MKKNEILWSKTLDISNRFAEMQ